MPLVYKFPLNGARMTWRPTFCSTCPPRPPSVPTSRSSMPPPPGHVRLAFPLSSKVSVSPILSFPDLSSVYRNVTGALVTREGTARFIAGWQVSLVSSVLYRFSICPNIPGKGPPSQTPVAIGVRGSYDRRDGAGNVIPLVNPCAAVDGRRPR